MIKIRADLIALHTNCSTIYVKCERPASSTHFFVLCWFLFLSLCASIFFVSQQQGHIGFCCQKVKANEIKRYKMNSNEIS